MRNMLNVALACASGGWATFPVGADGRSPLVASEEKGCGGVHMASRDPDTLRLWFQRPSNISLAAGEKSGVWVLDVDCKTPEADGEASLRALETEYGPLPPTPVSLTPKAGRHLFFKFDPARPLRNRVGFRPGLDVRTTGGSVCLPPSMRSDGAYRWLVTPRACPPPPAPVWLLEVIDPPAPVRSATPPLRLTSGERAVRYVVAAVDGECLAVAKTPANTGRNPRLFQAAARLGELVGSGLLPEDHAADALERAAHDCGLVRDDGMHSVRATIASGLRRGIAQPRLVEGVR